LKIALDNIDAVIKLIRGSSNTSEARDGLMQSFGLTEKQAQAILDMRLQRLTGLEREKIEEEYAELIKLINKFKEILANERVVYQIIREELLEVKEKYNDDRRTEIKASAEEIVLEDMIEEQNVAITLTHFGYIKRLPEDTYKIQRRGGRGISGITTREEDFVEHLFITSTHDNLLFLTNQGKVYSLKAYEIPDAKRQAKGTAIVNLLNLNVNEKITAIIPIKEFNPENYLVLLTKNGIIKKTELDKFDAIRKNGLIAINLRDDDELISVKKTDGNKDLILVTAQGMSIRFSENDVRDMGRTAMGVKAIKLNKNDKVISMNLVEEGNDLLSITEYGYGKRTPLEEYRSQTRGGKGIKTYNIKDRTGDLISANVVDKHDEVMMISFSGVVIRLTVAGITQMGRHTQGVTLMKLDKDDRVVSVAKVIAEEVEEE